MRAKLLSLLFGLMLCFTLAGVRAQDATPGTPPAAPTAETTPERTAEAPAEMTPEITAFTVTGTYTVRQPVGDIVRQYTVYVPPKYFELDTPVPLIMVLHGAGGTGQGMQSFSGFDALADKEGFIVAYPDAVSNAWNDGRGDGVSQINDLGYLAHLIDSVAEKANIDRTRVYATGYSRGGMMAYRLACAFPKRFTAVASVASTFPIYLISECQNAPPRPVMVIQGTDDPVIPWTGIPRAYLSAMNTLRFWGQQNRCSTLGPIREAVDLSPLDGTRLLIQAGSKCQQPVVLYGVFNGGHTWPGHPVQVDFDLGLTSADFDAAVAIWDFFQPLALEAQDS